MDLLVTATEAASTPWLRSDVCRHLIGMWRHQGKLETRGQRGRSPLFRLGEIVAVERSTRRSGFSHRNRGECQSCTRAKVRSAA